MATQPWYFHLKLCAVEVWVFLKFFLVILLNFHFIHHILFLIVFIFAVFFTA